MKGPGGDNRFRARRPRPTPPPDYYVCSEGHLHDRNRPTAAPCPNNKGAKR